MDSFRVRSAVCALRHTRRLMPAVIRDDIRYTIDYILVQYTVYMYGYDRASI